MRGDLPVRLICGRFCVIQANMKRLLIILLILFSSSVHALSNTALKSVEGYINELKTLEASFMQMTPEGGFASGKFYLSKPGKFRWEYDPPVPVLIVAKNGWVHYYDMELEQATHLRLSSTPAAFLVSENFKMSDFKVEGLKEEDGEIKLKLSPKDTEDQGSLALVFSKEPMLIKSFAVLDQMGNETLVELKNQEFGKELDEKLFRQENPWRFIKRKRN